MLPRRTRPDILPDAELLQSRDLERKPGKVGQVGGSGVVTAKGHQVDGSWRDTAQLGKCAEGRARDRILDKNMPI